MWTIGAGAMDRSADFVQLLSQFVQQIERGMDSGLRTWANETIRERLEAVEKDLPGPLEEIEIYLRSEGVDRTASRNSTAPLRRRHKSKPAFGVVETPETSGLVPIETESITDSLKQEGVTPGTNSTPHSDENERP